MWTKKITIALMVIGITIETPGTIGLVFSLTGQLSKNLIYAELTLILLGMFFFILGLVMNVRLKQNELIKKEGIDGTARIIEWWIVAKSGAAPMDMIERIRFHLEVTTDNSAPYQIKHSQLVPFNTYNRFTKGLTLPIKIHPRNPRRIVIIFE